MPEASGPEAARRLSIIQLKENSADEVQVCRWVWQGNVILYTHPLDLSWVGINIGSAITCSTPAGLDDEAFSCFIPLSLLLSSFFSLPSSQTFPLSLPSPSPSPESLNPWPHAATL